MKIIYDHQIFSRQSYGGISRYFHEISKRIPSIAQDEVEIFAPLSVNRYIPAQGIHIGKFKGGTPALGFVNTLLGKAFVSSRKDVAIFHETYYSGHSYAPKRAKRVVTVYDMIHELFPSSFSKYDRTSAAKLQAVHRADHVICISHSTRRDLLSMTSIPESKVSVVHLGYALATAPLAEIANNGASRPSAFLLYVGQRSGYKNFEAFLRAFASSASLKNNLSIICFGGGDLSSAEKQLISSLNIPLEKVIHMSGDDTSLARLYAAAAAFVYPSLYEGFGIPPLEAMAYNCPVVCSNSSSLPEVVGDAAELFDPTDLDSMRNAIEHAVESTDRPAQLIAEGQKRIQQFSWETCATATLNVYRSINEA